MTPKTPKDSETLMTNLVLNGDTNHLDSLFGGNILSWMDRCAYISASKHACSEVVTASINHVSFSESIPLGSIVTLKSNVSRAFKTSMEVWIEVWIEKPGQKIKTKVNEAIFTFVAVDTTAKPKEVPQIVPTNEVEKMRYDSALRRRQLSLILSKKMNPKDAHELKSLFTD